MQTAREVIRHACGPATRQPPGHQGSSSRSSPAPRAPAVYPFLRKVFQQNHGASVTTRCRSAHRIPEHRSLMLCCLTGTLARESDDEMSMSDKRPDRPARWRRRGAVPGDASHLAWEARNRRREDRDVPARVLEAGEGAGVLRWSADVVGGVPRTRTPSIPAVHRLRDGHRRGIAARWATPARGQGLARSGLQRGFDMAMNGIEDTPDRPDRPVLGSLLHLFAADHRAEVHQGHRDARRSKSKPWPLSARRGGHLRGQPGVIRWSARRSSATTAMGGRQVDAVLLDKPIAWPTAPPIPSSRTSASPSTRGRYVIVFRTEDTDPRTPSARPWSR